MLKEPYKQETLSQESSPTSPSDLAKLEITVLSILEAQACSLAEEKSEKTQVLSGIYAEQTKDTYKTKPLPIAPESCSSDDEDLTMPKIQGKNGGTPAEDGKQSMPSQKKYKQMASTMEDASTRRQRYDSVEDSSESENSPVPQRKRRTSVGSSSSDEYKPEDSPGSGDEEELIRKQILEMSADEDASGSEDDKFIRNQLKEISANESPIKEELKSKKGTAGKHKRIMRKSSIGYEEDAIRRHSWHDDDEEDDDGDDDETFDESPESKSRETKSQDSEEATRGGLRRFKTIELNSTIANKYSEESEQPKRSLYFDEEPELEMESLTDSPEDRSRGEGSSSLHASSFTPGTSPTSVSSLDEDSDSSPSHKKIGGESKQHRKARHRTHGPLLPTIEDSSEEEELREEEELLKEQEKQRELEQQQRKSSSKKSKKDKDELRAQRRRERPKTPPSNLSPIEDASPTEELRQAAEMEELHRSSCSEYSPSIESDPEAFEISPEKIIEVQKVYKLPTSVSLYSPTEEQLLEIVTENSGLKTLKSAEEVYEEMLHTSHKGQKFADVSEKDEVFEKEPLYGGMLIEDYIYESLVEDTYSGAPEASLIAKQNENDEFSQQRDKEKKTKPFGQPDGGPIQKSIDVQKEYYSIESLHSVISQEDIVCSSYIMPESHEIVVLESEAPSSSDEKQLLDADAAYEELMKQQGMQLSPSSSPTQLSPESMLPSDTMTSRKASDTMSSTSSTPSAVLDRPSLISVVLPIPDVRITQHFTADEIEDEYLTDYAQETEEVISHEASILTYSEASESAASILPSDTSSLTSSTSSVYTTGSSSPVAGPDGMILAYGETVDTVSKLSDFDRTSTVNQVPITSTKEYSESAVLFPKKAFLAEDAAHVDQVSVFLPEVASITATYIDTKPRPVVPVSVAMETVSSEEDKTRKDVITHKGLTSQHFELGSRAASSQALSAGRDEVPINLSLGTPVTWASTNLVTVPPVSVTSVWANVGTAHEPMESGVVDLSTTKSHRTMVSVDEMTSGIVTTVIEDDEKPVDLTAGRRAVCCDVIYKLPFSRSCTAQAPATTLPEDRFGYRDDHYQYDRSGPYSYRSIGGMKPSMSDTNLSEAGLFLYKSKNTFDYQAGETDVAVDLTSGRVMTGEIVDYSSKITGPYPETRQVVSGMGISAPQYSQARIVPTVGSPYGIGSVLRSSNGVVYSSVATPVPSTYAITTQPGSIFSTSVSALPTADKMPSLSTWQQNQAPPKSYSFLTTMSSDKEGKITDIDIEPVLHPHSIETITNEPTNLLPIFTTASEAFMDVIQDEATLLIAPQEGKQQHLDLERELLELEKLKQQRFAEELEWERQEIQRFREQEQFMVQKKLEELQSMKHHLLYQQEEERQAQFMMRQETLAQQQLHIEQIQQLQQQLHQHLEEQKIHQIYQYNYDPSRTVSPPTTTDPVIIEDQYAAAVNSQFWTGEEATSTTSAVLGTEIPQSQAWYTLQSDGVTQYIPRPGILNSVSDMSLKDIDVREEKQLKKRSSMPKLLGPYEELDETMEEEPRCLKNIAESGVQTDDEDSADTNYTDKRQRTKKGVDTSVQTDDEDQDEWDPTSRSGRKTHAGKYEVTTEVDKAKPFSKFSSTAVQTVAEISVQTEPVGMIRTPSIRAQLDAKVEIVKHISAPENMYKGRSLGCQTETDSQSSQYLTAISPQKDKKRPTPLEIGYSTHLRPEPTLQAAPSPPKSPKVLYSPISPVSPAVVIESAFVPYEKPLSEDISPQKIAHGDVTKITQLSPKSAKVMQRSLSDPKPLSPTAEDPSRGHFQYSDSFLVRVHLFL
ncbi:UNVERIFIED_CONTAM: hypothetical protein K2H54_054607 [Gekko kuhli]